MPNPQLVPEPTMTGDDAPKPFLLVLDDPKVSEEYYQKSLEHKLQLRRLGDSVFLVFSYDAPDYTLRWLKSVQDLKMTLIVLDSYSVYG